MDEIILINNIMEENKKQLALLKDQLRKSGAKVSALQERLICLIKDWQKRKEKLPI